MESSGKVDQVLLPHFSLLFSEGAGETRGGRGRKKQEVLLLWGLSPPPFSSLALFCGVATERVFPHSPPPACSPFSSLAPLGGTLRIFGKVPPGHPVFRNISRKDLSSAVSVPLNTFLRTGRPESSKNLEFVVPQGGMGEGRGSARKPLFIQGHRLEVASQSSKSQMFLI